MIMVKFSLFVTACEFLSLLTNADTLLAAQALKDENLAIYGTMWLDALTAILSQYRDHNFTTGYPHDLWLYFCEWRTDLRSIV